MRYGFLERHVPVKAFCLLALISPNLWGMDLLEAYETGLQNDPVVLQAEAKRNALERGVDINIARLLPQLSFNGNLSHNRVDTARSPILLQNQTNNTFWNSYYAVHLDQPLFHYESWAQLWQADDQLAQAQAELEAAYQAMAIRVAQAYFGALAADDDSNYLEQNVDRLKKQLEQTNERLSAGFSTIVDQREVQAQLDQATSDLIYSVQRREDSREALKEIIGVTPHDLRGLPDQLPLEEPDPPDVNQWQEVALQSNLGIMVATSAAEAAQKNIDINFAGHLPSLDLVGDRFSTDTDRYNGIVATGYNVGLQVNVPIFSGGGVSAKTNQARDYYEQALYELDRQRRAAVRQLQNSFRGIRASISRVKALGAAIASAQVALEGAEAGYQVGTRTVTDVLYQQGRLVTAQRDYAKARYEYLINGLQLKQASGTLKQEDMAQVNRLIRDAHREGSRQLDSPSKSLYQKTDKDLKDAPNPKRETDLERPVYDY
jgi:outer membrane protein